MKYVTRRDNIKSGDILAWRNNDWNSLGGLVSQIIRIWERSEYSHVGTAVVLNGRVFVLEAIAPHPRLVPLSNRLPCFWTPINAPWTRETEEYAFSLLGIELHRYSYLEAIKAVFHRTKMDNLWQCAEMVWAIAHKDGINLGVDIYPSGIMRAAQMHGDTRYLEE